MDTCSLIRSLPFVAHGMLRNEYANGMKLPICPNWQEIMLIFVYNVLLQRRVLPLRLRTV